MKAYRNGQAALEFLTTYGWAFLVILVMIGALAYFGVVNPNRLLPERCQFQQEFTCRDHQATYTTAATAKVQLYLMNNVGEAVNTIKLSVKSPDNTATTTCVADGDGTLGTGESGSWTCTGVAGAFVQGNKAKFLVNGTYKVVSGKYARPINGDLFLTVQ